MNKSAELFRYREMFVGLVSREVRARYKGSALGFLWSLLNPLLMMLIYTLIFSVYMRINMPNFSFFLFCGLLPWTWFSTSILNASASVVANGSLIKKVYFPMEILPAVSVTTNLVNYVFSMPILFLFMGISGLSFTWNLLFLPLLLLIQYFLTLGFSLILSTLNAFYRDVEQLLNPLLLAWFYLTPVIYPLTTIPEKFKPLLYLNPMGPLIVSYQNIFYYGQPPALGMLLYCVGFGVVMFLLGYAIFYRKKFVFAEVI